MKNLALIHLAAVTALCLILITACEREKEIDLTIPFEGEKLVVYGLISNATYPRLEVYHTRPVDAVDVPELGPVTALIRDEDENVHPFFFEGNVGSSLITTHPEKMYSVSVMQGSLSVVSTPVTIPPVVAIDTVQLGYSVDSTSVTLSVYFDDPPDEENYYGFSITKMKGGEIVEEGEVNLRTLLSDEDFNGQRYRILMEEGLRIPVINSDFQLIRVDTVEAMYVKLFNVSPHVYDFYESIRDNGGELGNQYAEQTPLRGNIIDGYGYFGGAAVDSFYLER